jgi:hypothetical protein
MGLEASQARHDTTRRESMVKFVKGALLAAAASLALTSVASAQTLTDAEFKCIQKTNKAGAKFVNAKAKCGSKCIQNAGKSLNPYSDCFAPYAGTTLACVADPLKGAEAKFALAIKKACDPGTVASADCPECFSGGDCSDSGEAGSRVQNIEGQVDSFGPGVFCEQPGADAAETACELNTAKTLAKLVGSVNKCYDKCYGNARKGLISEATCVPPASDPTTATCISAADAKSIAGVNKKCGDLGAIPDCSATDDYPDGAAWTNLVDIAISGNIPSTNCGSPSGAFVD